MPGAGGAPSGAPGKVGLGTDSPAEPVHVVGNLRVDGTIKSEAAPLKLAIGATDALRLEPTAGTPNIIGGHDQNSAFGQGAVIVGGGQVNQSNNVNEDFGFIGGGFANQVGTAGSSSNGFAAVIVGGVSHFAPGNHSAILDGESNGAHGDASAVGGGTDNFVGANTDHGCVPGGAENNVDFEYGVATGFQARSRGYGQMAHAAGGFSKTGRGEAQTYTYVVRGVTTDATPTELFLDGAARQILLASDTTVAFDALVVGRDDDLGCGVDSAAYRITGLIERCGSITVGFVGTPALTVLAEDDATWTAAAQIISSGASLGLKIVVTGSAGQTTRWVATVRTAEVRH